MVWQFECQRAQVSVIREMLGKHLVFLDLVDSLGDRDFPFELHKKCVDLS